MRFTEFYQKQSDIFIETLQSINESEFQAWILESDSQVLVKTCPLFDTTVQRHKDEIENPLKRFIEFKRQNPLKPINKSDYPFTNEGFFRGFTHAHLTHDISIWYTLSGHNPRILKLYGVFTHEEAGIGTPAKRPLQRQLRSRLDQQTFQ